MREKVCDIFDIDEDLLYDLASGDSDDSDYWNSSHTFYEQVKDKDAVYLTHKQRSWLTKIEDGLAERG